MTACHWDGGDCTALPSSHYGEDFGFSGKVEHCASGCPDSWIGDTVCDAVCNVAACGFDAGDCGLEILRDNTVAEFSLSANLSRIEVSLSLCDMGISPFDSHPFSLAAQVPHDAVTVLLDLTGLYQAAMKSSFHDNPDLVCLSSNCFGSSVIGSSSTCFLIPFTLHILYAYY